MKITLVYPALAQVGFLSFGRGTPTTDLMSLGLGYLGAVIRERTDYQVDLVDLRKLSGWDDYRRELEDRSPDVVGVNTNTVNFDFAVKSAAIASDMGKTVIAGGPHATLAPEELLGTGHVDHVITGEAEITIVEVLDRINRGLHVDPVIQGKAVEDLDSLPFPDRDLFDMDKSLSLPGFYPFPHRYAGILASRGCPFNCAFCQPLERKIFGKKIKLRSVDNIIGEVRLLKERYKADFIMFQDDQLTHRKSWVLDLCSEIKKLNVTWGALARVNTIDEDIVRAMKEAGCAVLQFGFESGSQRMLDFLRKNARAEQAIRAAELCHEHGIIIFANYIMGIPTETEDDLMATLKLMKEINPEIHAANYFSPIPGSDLYEYCDGNDLIRATSYDMFVRGAVGNKVKGIDYERLDRMKEKIDKFKPSWYREGHYARLVWARWSGLARQGHFAQAAKEFVAHTPILDGTIGAAYRMLKKGA